VKIHEKKLRPPRLSTILGAAVATMLTSIEDKKRQPKMPAVKRIFLPCTL
jgi:hypothetical protein